eukprot:3342895-Pleurochrysis_carterae.AAC.5
MVLNALWPPKSQKIIFALRICMRPMLSPMVGAILPGASGSLPRNTAFICSSSVCDRSQHKAQALIPHATNAVKRKLIGTWVLRAVETCADARASRCVSVQISAFSLPEAHKGSDLHQP